MCFTELIANKYSINYYSLDELGVNSVAFEKREALQILENLKNEIIPIIGIDIYEMKEGIIDFSSNYDSWSCDRKEKESLSDFVKRSHKSAYEYVDNYNITDGFPLFDLVAFDIKQI